MRATRGGGARLDVVAAGRPGRDGGPALGPGDYPRLARLLAERYPLTLIDPAPSSLARALALANQSRQSANFRWSNAEKLFEYSTSFGTRLPAVISR